MRLLKRRTAAATETPAPDYVGCVHASGDYCVDRLAAGHLMFHSLCPSCLAWTMAALDVAAKRYLDWSPVYRQRAGVDSPAELDADRMRRAGL